jgi:hypothetical protein
MNAYNQTGAEVEHSYFGAEAEAIEGYRADCRETVAYLLEIRSELKRNGVEHTSADLVELARIAIARTCGWPQRERNQPF